MQERSSDLAKTSICCVSPRLIEAYGRWMFADPPQAERLQKDRVGSKHPDGREGTCGNSQLGCIFPVGPDAPEVQGCLFLVDLGGK